VRKATDAEKEKDRVQEEFNAARKKRDEEERPAGGVKEQVPVWEERATKAAEGASSSEVKKAAKVTKEERREDPICEFEDTPARPRLLKLEEGQSARPFVAVVMVSSEEEEEAPGLSPLQVLQAQQGEFHSPAAITGREKEGTERERRPRRQR